jgi:hypothetical protein
MVQILASFIFISYLCGRKVQQSNIRNYETVNGSDNGGNNDSAYSKRYQAD